MVIVEEGRGKRIDEVVSDCVGAYLQLRQPVTDSDTQNKPDRAADNANE